MEYRTVFIDKNRYLLRESCTNVEQKWIVFLTDGHLNAILRISTPKTKPTFNKLVDTIQTQK